MFFKQSQCKAFFEKCTCYTSTVKTAIKSVNESFLAGIEQDEAQNEEEEVLVDRITRLQRVDKFLKCVQYLKKFFRDHVLM